MRKLRSSFSIVAGIIALFLMANAVFADVDITPKAVYNLENGSIVVSGNVDSNYVSSVMIAVYYPNYTKEMVKDGTATAEAAVANVDETTIIDNSYKYEFTLSDSAPEGTYTVYVNLGNGVVKNCPVEYGKTDGVLEALQGAVDLSDEEKLSTFSANEKFFIGSYDAFNRLTDEGKDSVVIDSLSDNDYNSIAEFSEKLNVNSVIWLFKNSENYEDIEYLINNYSDVLGLDLNNSTYTTYIKPVRENFEALCRMIITQNYRKSDDAKTAFDKAAVMTALNKIESMGQIKLIAEKNLTLLALSMTAYDKLKYPSAVLTNLYDSKANAVTTCEAFKTLWEAAVSRQKAAEAAESSGNSPSGGSPSGGAVSSGVTSGGPRNGSYPTSTATQVVQTPETSVEKPLFNDLGSSAWAEKAITTLAKAGIINGKSENTFAPDDNITREEFLKMLFLCANLKVDSDSTCGFADVAEDDWYYGYIATANAMGLVNGVTEESFGVGNNITREDIAVMVIRTVSKLGIELVMPYDKKAFSDNDSINGYAKESVYAMQKAGIINGYDDGTFLPQANATRAEAAQIIYKICNLFLN